MKKQIAGALAAVLLVAGLANASAIKVWVSGELLRYTDLNANFAHIHATMVGSHGARLVNSDVSATAAIALTKLATPQLIPKMFVSMGSVCAAGTCSTVSSQGITSVTWQATGIYRVNFTARPDALYAAFVSSSTNLVNCIPYSKTTTYTAINCIVGTTAADSNADFNFMLMDNP